MNKADSEAVAAALMGIAAEPYTEAHKTILRLGCEEGRAEPLSWMVEAFKENGGNIVDLLKAARELRNEPGVREAIDELRRFCDLPDKKRPQWLREALSRDK